MKTVQLELNLFDLPESEFKIQSMQKQLDDMNESMDKVRRKLFSELTELKKTCFSLVVQNKELTDQIKFIINSKNEYMYSEDELFFKTN